MLSPWKTAISSIVIAITIVGETEAHGYVSCPLPRQYRTNDSPFSWTNWVSIASGSTANDAFAGGIGNAANLNAFIPGASGWQTEETIGHGICGDTMPRNGFTAKSGLYGPTESRGTYVAGGILDVEVKLTAYHGGHFEFRVCDLPDGADDISNLEHQDCLNKNVLQINENTPEYAASNNHGSTRFDYMDLVEGVRCPNNRNGYWPHGSCCNEGGNCSSPEDNIHRWVIPNNIVGSFQILLDIPEDLDCEHCVLQWYYQTGNSVDHYPEAFWNCVDITILPAGTDGVATGCGATSSPTSASVITNAPTRDNTPTPAPTTSSPTEVVTTNGCCSYWGGVCAECGDGWCHTSQSQCEDSCSGTWLSHLSNPCEQAPTVDTTVPQGVTSVAPDPTAVETTSSTSAAPPITNTLPPSICEKPADWKCAWPSTSQYPCCSKWGYQGATSGYCSHLDSRDLGACSCSESFGVWVCGPTSNTTGPAPNCTGNAAIDAILHDAQVNYVSQVENSAVYTWEGFCSAVSNMIQLETGAHSGKSLQMFFGDGSGSEQSLRESLVNIAGLLSQCMWESGGEAPWSACDENDYTNSPTSACTQRADGSLYADLTSNVSCSVDPDMRMTAVTYATWTNGPMECTPDTVTEGCCWWGRGAIQTTGPHNVAMLQRDVVGQLGEFDSTDLCTNPEAICEHDELKWIGAIYYWTTIVQQEECFRQTLSSYAQNFSEGNPVANCINFPRGVGGSINNGVWNAPAHREGGRLAYFHSLMDALSEAYSRLQLPRTTSPTEVVTTNPVSNPTDPVVSTTSASPPVSNAPTPAPTPSPVSNAPTLAPTPSPTHNSPTPSPTPKPSKSGGGGGGHTGCCSTDGVACWSCDGGWCHESEARCHACSSTATYIANGCPASPTPAPGPAGDGCCSWSNFGTCGDCGSTWCHKSADNCLEGCGGEVYNHKGNACP